MSTFQERIKELRKENKLTLANMSEIAGVSARQIGNYEAGKAVPKDDVLVRICEKLSVNLSWLKEGEGEKAKAQAKEHAAKEVKKTKPAPAKKAAAKTGTGQPVLYIQSQSGGQITPEVILKRVHAVAPDAVSVYVKSEENKAYWVSKKENGFVLLWDPSQPTL